MKENVTIILGAQWGDEGKGKIVDLLSDTADVVCRFQGGNNAGHTVVVDDKSFKFHLLPCGILKKNCICVIGNGVVVNLPELLQEIESNVKICGDSTDEWMKRLYISSEAHLVFDIYRCLDGYIEADKLADNRQIGTTKKGIGPAYASKALRMGIRMEDLVEDFQSFETEFKKLVEYNCKQFKERATIDTGKEIILYKLLAEKFRPCVIDTALFINKCIKEGKKVLIEGANGSMLDIDRGTYPYVTSSNCTIGGACTGLGVPNDFIGFKYGVVKAYCTRVGDGPFPTELFDSIGDILQREGGEVGVTTKRLRRCGWLDGVLLKYTHMLNNYTALALTKLDVLSSLDEIKIGVSYSLDGQVLESPPMNAKKLSRIQVEYKTFDGWKSDISQVRRYEDLPDQAKIYVKAIEDIVEVPVKWIGVGQHRNAIIYIQVPA